MLRAEVRPIPIRRVLSEWLSLSAFSDTICSRLGEDLGGVRRPWVRTVPRHSRMSPGVDRWLLRPTLFDRENLKLFDRDITIAARGV